MAPIACSQDSKPQAGSSSHSAARQVIDLTDSPPPPDPDASLPQAQPQVQPRMGNLPADLATREAVCIGVIPAQALLRCPVSYILPEDPGSLEAEWAPVRLQPEHLENKPKGQSENINVLTPPLSFPSGEVLPSAVFAVVEEKVANIMGPLVRGRLVRLDAKIRRAPLAPTVALQILVYTPKGNIPVVSGHMQQHGLLLDHPVIPADVDHLSSHYYYNPHAPPPGALSRPPAVADPGCEALVAAAEALGVHPESLAEALRCSEGDDMIDEADLHMMQFISSSWFAQSCALDNSHQLQSNTHM